MARNPLLSGEEAIVRGEGGRGGRFSTMDRVTNVRTMDRASDSERGLLLPFVLGRSERALLPQLSRGTRVAELTNTTSPENTFICLVL